MITFSFSTGFLFEKKKKCEHGFNALVLLDGDGQHEPNEIPQLLVPLTDDTADIVVGFRSFGQMPAYRRLGRTVLDHATGGPVRDSQSGFRALNRKAIELLAGTLVKDDFAVESEMTYSKRSRFTVCERANQLQIR